MSDDHIAVVFLLRGVGAFLAHGSQNGARQRKSVLGVGLTYLDILPFNRTLLEGLDVVTLLVFDHALNLSQSA